MQQQNEPGLKRIRTTEDTNDEGKSESKAPTGRRVVIQPMNLCLALGVFLDV